MKQKLQGKKRGVKRFFSSLRHALDGLIYAFTVEQNMFIHVATMVIIIGMGIFFQINTLEWLFCLVMFGLVISTELINTAIEAVVDLVTEKYEILAKVAKDTAAAAVLVFALTALTGGIVIFLPKMIKYFLELM